MAKKKKRQQGHYCKICGRYKANEKFSGKGHAAHICKECSRLSAAEKAESQTMNRLMELPFRHLSAGDKNWLEKCTRDRRPEIAEVAKQVFRECFPYAERNAMKKQLIVSILEFEVHTEVYQDYGDWETVNQRFSVNRKERTLAFLDIDSAGTKQTIVLDGGRMAKLLQWIVHTLEIFMWPQDYRLASEKNSLIINLSEDVEEDCFADMKITHEEMYMEECQDEELTWCVRIEYTNGYKQDMSCYGGQLMDKPEELYYRLLEIFEPEDDDSVLE